MEEFHLEYPDASIIPELEKLARGGSVDSSVSVASGAKILKQASNEDPNIPIDPNNNGFYNGLDWLLMVPQKPVEIQCGRRIKIVAGWEFKCWDYVESLYWGCLGRTDNHYVCWDGGEWEWPNYHEMDGSVDQSLLTSIATDGVFETSPSVDPNPGALIPPQLMAAVDPVELDLLTDIDEVAEAYYETGYDLELASPEGEDGFNYEFLQA